MGIPVRPLDVAPGGACDREGHGRGVPPRSCLADSSGSQVESTATGASGEGAKRESHQAMGGPGLAADKKNARRQRAWIVFQDESGVSDRPPIRTTWAPQGQTPVVTHPYHWKKVSVSGALAYRWDGRRCRLVFQTKPDNYNTASLIRFLRILRKHFRQKVILVWDRLHAHKSKEMARYLANCRRWLRVEWLPGYAPDLNPVEALWGNVKGQELANLEVEDTLDVVDGLRAGLRRAQRSNLGFAFLQHTGLSFD
jgi:DDE superfamily endonuclease